MSLDRLNQLEELLSTLYEQKYALEEEADLTPRSISSNSIRTTYQKSYFRFWILGFGRWRVENYGGEGVVKWGFLNGVNEINYWLRFYWGLPMAIFRLDSLCQLLRSLGFDERIRGSHHIFTQDGIEEILNLQPKKGKAKAYQVKQVRDAILKYQLGGQDEN